MGVFTAAGRKVMLDAIGGTNPALSITHVGLMTKGANRSVTGTASTDVIADTATPYANGDIVVLSGLTGGTGLFVDQIYFIINKNTNDYQLAHSPGGSAVDFTTNLTAATINKLTEISGGSPAYARKAIAWSAAVDPGTKTDSTNGAVFDVPAAAVVDYVSGHSASSAGTLLVVDAVTQESFGSQGTYTLTNADLDLMDPVGAI